jgi:hypothetical protein
MHNTGEFLTNCRIPDLQVCILLKSVFLSLVTQVEWDRILFNIEAECAIMIGGRFSIEETVQSSKSDSRFVFSDNKYQKRREEKASWSSIKWEAVPVSGDDG